MFHVKHAALVIGLAWMMLIAAGCPSTSSETDSNRQFPLDSLPTRTVTYDGAPITVWIADDNATRAEGLMFVPEADLEGDVGMLFIFEREQALSFWMRNTPTALDIAYIRTDGEIVTIHEMPPFTLQSFPSFEPARFALEMKAGSFARLGIVEGGRLEIPAAVLQ